MYNAIVLIINISNNPESGFLSDQEFANDYLTGKFNPEYNNAGVSVNVTIAKAPNEWSSSCDYVVISSTKCTMPSS